jgi:ABC-type Fe3+-hydroxamate transport system substrate-binding protein
MEFIDQIGNKLQLSTYPKRIISLVPSITELLFDLGLDEDIVGITQYCILPAEKVLSRVKVGGVQQLDFQRIMGLKPDLLIGSKEENSREEIGYLQQHYPVWISNVTTLDDLIDMNQNIGQVVNRSAAAARINQEIRTALDTMPAYPGIKVAYLIWNGPLMVAGGDTFINTMLEFCGFENIFCHLARYPQITLKDLSDAEVIFLSSEPYPFSEDDLDFFRAKFPNQKVIPVDGLVFSWYGSHPRNLPAACSTLRQQFV